MATPPVPYQTPMTNERGLPTQIWAAFFRTLASASGGGGGGTGTVTSVALSAPAIFTVSGSPVTSSGTLSFTLAAQSANTVFAGPTSGAAGAPTFRALVAGDIPTLNQNTTGSAGSFTGSLSGDVTGTQSATVVGKINGVSLAGLSTGILKNTTTTGAPSIAVAADFPTLNQNTTGSAASFTGNLAGDVTGTQGATTVGKINGTSLAGLATGILKNTTTTGVPSIAVAADFPTLNQNTTGTAANVTGTVALGNGGTGQTTAAAAYNALSPMTTLGDIEYESAANTASRLAGNTSATKKFLTQTGTGTVSAAPGWSTIAAADLPSPFTSGTASGSTSKFATVTGTLTSGHLATWDASGNLIDGGAVPSGGGGTVTSVAMSVPAGMSVSGSPVTSTGTLAVTGFPNLAFASKTANYTLTATDQVILASASGGAFTLTLPAASSNSGKVFYLKKTDSTTNAVTISRAGSDTIEGATTTTLNTQYEILTLVSDGVSVWNILSRDYSRGLKTYTATLTGTTVAGSVTYTANTCEYRRNGDSIDVSGYIQFNTVTTSPTGSMAISLPSGLTRSTSNLGSAAGSMRGTGVYFQNSSGTKFSLMVDVNGGTSSQFVIDFATTGGTGGFPTLAANDTFRFYANIPISGWN